MKKISIKYGNWILLINIIKNELEFKNENLEDKSHVYDMDENPMNIDVDDEYVMIRFSNTYWAVKFENNNDLIIDEYDNDDEFIRTIGCYSIDN